MILIVCLDDKNGMAFNRRRQSQDALAREKILSLTGGGPLWMNAYSTKQFGDAPNIRVEEDFLQKAGPGEYAFAEFPPLSPIAKAVERIYVIRWNRRCQAGYPPERGPLEPGGVGGFPRLLP